MIEWSRTPSGEYGARSAGRALCSSRDPRKEARAWCDHHAELATLNDWTVVGIGAGYHLFEMRRRWPAIRIQAFDLNLELRPENLPLALQREFRRLTFCDLYYGVSEPKVLPRGPIVIFRAASSAQDEKLYNMLLGQTPEALRLWSQSVGYEQFAIAADSIPENLAINIKALPSVATGSRENRILQFLRELIA